MACSSSPHQQRALVNSWRLASMKAWCSAGSGAAHRGSISLPPPVKRPPSGNLPSKNLMSLVDHWCFFSDKIENITYSEQKWFTCHNLLDEIVLRSLRTWRDQSSPKTVWAGNQEPFYYSSKSHMQPWKFPHSLFNVPFKNVTDFFFSNIQTEKQTRDAEEFGCTKSVHSASYQQWSLSRRRIPPNLPPKSL